MNSGGADSLLNASLLDQKPSAVNMNSCGSDLSFETVSMVTKTSFLNTTDSSEIDVVDCHKTISQSMERVVVLINKADSTEEKLEEVVIVNNQLLSENNYLKSIFDLNDNNEANGDLANNNDDV